MNRKNMRQDTSDDILKSKYGDILSAFIVPCISTSDESACRCLSDTELDDSFNKA